MSYKGPGFMTYVGIFLIFFLFTLWIFPSSKDPALGTPGFFKGIVTDVEHSNDQCIGNVTTIHLGATAGSIYDTVRLVLKGNITFVPGEGVKLWFHASDNCQDIYVLDKRERY